MESGRQVCQSPQQNIKQITSDSENYVGKMKILCNKAQKSWYIFFFKKGKFLHEKNFIPSQLSDGVIKTPSLQAHSWQIILTKTKNSSHVKNLTTFSVCLNILIKLFLFLLSFSAFLYLPTILDLAHFYHTQNQKMWAKLSQAALAWAFCWFREQLWWLTSERRWKIVW